MKRAITLLALILILCGFSSTEKPLNIRPLQEGVISQSGFNSNPAPISTASLQFKPVLTADEKILAHIRKMSPVILERRKAEVDNYVRLVFRETEGEAWIGQLAVTYIVLSRMLSDRFENSISDVIFEKSPGRRGLDCQFDAVCDSKGLSVEIPDDMYKQIEDIVWGVLRGELSNPCSGAFFYFNPDDITSYPSFALKETYLCKIGKHAFYGVLPWKEFLALRAEKAKDGGT